MAMPTFLQIWSASLPVPNTVAIYLEKIDKQIVGATVEANGNKIAGINMRPPIRGPDAVSIPLKTLLFAATILVAINMTGAQASVVFDGVAYPDGCRN